jgi:hypothetical protein
LKNQIALEQIEFNQWSLFTSFKMSLLKVSVMSFSFIFFFQLFFNVKDFNVLYIFSKAVMGAFAVISFIIYLIKAAVYGISIKHSSYLIFLFFVLISISTISSHIVFGQPLLEGIMAQVKLTGIFYYFLAFSLFAFLKPNIKDFEKTFVYLGLGTLIIYTLVNLFINPASVWTKESDIVIKDSLRGYRFRLKDVFIIIYLFYALGKFLAGRQKMIMATLIILILLYLVVYQEERAELLSIVAVLGWRFITKSSAVVKSFFVILVSGVFILIVLYPDKFSGLLSSVDTTSLQTRANTFGITYRFISSGFTNFLFGAGNLNSLWKGGFESLYGENFFLSDIGWGGIVFEFGFLGAILCFIAYLKILKDVENTNKKYNSFLLSAFTDYILARLILSVISPHIPYFIGIYATLLAISVYLRKFQTKYFNNNALIIRRLIKEGN